MLWNKAGDPVAPRLDDLKIGDLAKATGKTARALRLYEEMGLLEPDLRTQGGFRVYDHDAVERVRFISELQDMGFTLHDVKALIDAAAEKEIPREAMGHVKATFTAKLGELEAQIARLSTLRAEVKRALAYLDVCGGCGAEHAGPKACVACEEHGDQNAPLLIQGVTKSARPVKIARPGDTA